MEKLCTNKNHSYKHNEQINKQNIDNSECFGVKYVKIYHIQQSSVKNIRKCKKKFLYNQPKPYLIFFLLWSHFWINFNIFYTKTFGHKYSSPSILRYIFHIKPHFSNKLLLRDRPFNLKGGGYGFLFRTEFFFWPYLIFFFIVKSFLDKF
jgi:hypothetical protein